MLRNLWKWFNQAGKTIGDIQARILLMCFYFTILGPFALALGRRSDPLGIKSGLQPNWHLKDKSAGSPMERASRQS